MLDMDFAKRLGDDTVSPVSSSRRNVLGLHPFYWLRIAKELKYHPYKPIRRHELKPADLPRQLEL